MSGASYDLVVFDWDGTLADSETRIVECAMRAIDQVALPPRTPDQIRDIIGLGFDEAIGRLFPGALGQRTCRAFAAAYREHFARFASEPVPLFTGARGVLEALRDEGLSLAVATGKSRRGLDWDLAETGISHLFDGTRCADEAPSKPHPGMLLELMGDLGTDPGETLMVGDTTYDMEMARAAGVARIGVATGVHAAERLLEFEALAVLDTVADLPGWLTGS